MTRRLGPRPLTGANVLQNLLFRAARVLQWRPARREVLVYRRASCLSHVQPVQLDDPEEAGII